MSVVHVDGNAAAGVLREVFATEMTAAACACGHCGAAFVLAQAHAYMRAPGVVLRCPACSGVLLRIVRLPETLSVEMRGLARLAISVTDEFPGRAQSEAYVDRTGG